MNQASELKFSKLNGQGNDFILIDGYSNAAQLDQRDITAMCDRHFGIGADGLIIVRPSPTADFKMDYYNSDGSIAEMCGNGIRCMARFIWEKGLSPKLKLNIETLAGLKKIDLNVEGKKISNIRVNMGSPAFLASTIPAKLPLTEEVFEYRLEAEGHYFDINLVSMGNPHCIIILDKKEDLDKVELEKWGPIIEAHPIFPRKTNVEFIQVQDKQSLSMRVWERGVGQTLACGTGACASTVAAIKLGKIVPGKTKVFLPGGMVYVTWTGEGDVYLEGTTEYVFDGNYFLAKEGLNS